MAAPTILQSGHAQSSSAAPATFSGTFGAGSTAGTCLVVVVGCAMSAAGSVTVPSPWLEVTTSAQDNAAILLRVRVYPNNPGSVTGTGTMTLTNVNGIAVCWYELTGISLPAASVLGRLDTVAIGSSTAPGVAATTPTDRNSVWIGAIANLATQTLTAANLPASGIGAWTTGPTGTSTLGATNVQLSTFASQPGAVYPTGGVLQCKGTLGGAVAWVGSQLAIPATESGALASMTAESGLGMLTGGGAGYAIGG